MNPRNYAATLRLPKTSFPMRALDSGNDDGRRQDVETLFGATGSMREAEGLYGALRNCFRWMLGCLAHADERRTVWNGVPPLERHAAATLLRRAAKQGLHLALEDGAAMAENVLALAREDLMGFYYDVRKDALYCDPDDSSRRLASLAFTGQAFATLAEMAWPVAPNLVREASGHFRRTGETVAFPPVPPGWDDVRAVRKATLALLAGERQRNAFVSSLDLRLVLYVHDERLAASLAASEWNPAETLCVSQAEVQACEPPAGGLRTGSLGGFGVVATLAEGRRCARSLRVTADVGDDPAFPDLSARDAAAMRQRELQPTE